MTKVNQCQDPSFDKKLMDYCQNIVDAQANKDSATTNQDVQHFLEKAMRYIDNKVVPESKKSDLTAQTHRHAAYESYRTAVSELQTVRSGKRNSGSSFDPTLFLSSYQQASIHHRFGCDLVDEDQVKSSQDLDYEEIITKSKTGDDSCAVLGPYKSWAIDLAETTDFVPVKTINIDVLDWITKHSRFTTYAQYKTFGSRSGIGAGASAEILSPITQAPLVIGGELRLSTFPTFDSANVFTGELKTWETMIDPPLFEFGYQGKQVTALLQTGLWFTGYKLINPRAATNPYSENIFENPQYQVGLKAYLLNDKLMISAGYEHSPWGSGSYTNVGYVFKAPSKGDSK